MANSPEGHTAIQRDLDRLQKWADKNFSKFNIEKCRVLHGEEQYYIPVNALGHPARKHLCRKELRNLVDTKLNMRQQCTLPLRLMIFFPALSRELPLSQELFFPLYSVLVRLHLEYSVQFWAPQCKTEVELLEEVL